MMKLRQTLFGLAALSAGACLPAVACTNTTTSPIAAVYDPLFSGETQAFFTISSVPADGDPTTNQRGITLVQPLFGSDTQNIEYDLDIFSVSGTFAGVQNDIVQYFDPQTGLFSPGPFSLNSVTAEGEVSLTVRLTIAPGQLNIASGTHALTYLVADQYNTDVLCPNWGGTNNEVGLSFDIVVPSSLSLNMAGGGVGGTIDFGTSLGAGAQQTVQLTVNSTNPFEVTLDSEHDGVLKLGDDPNSSSEVTYSTTLAGQVISEATPYADNTPTGTGGADSTLEFVVTIGDTATQRAGLYKDTVTLTVAAIP